MRFVYNDRKTAQAAAYVVALNGGRLNYMVLIKLLYLSDRRSLLEIGTPITGDRMVSMPHGPVLSRTLDQINMGRPISGTSPWYEYLTEPAGYEVSLASILEETDELSNYERRVLRETFEEFGNMNKWSLRDFTHTLPEWHDPAGSSRPIDPVDILRYAGVPDATISELVSDAEEMWFVEELATISS